MSRSAYGSSLPSSFPLAESYISELRTFVPFDTLRSELRSNLASLNRELVDRDYADFVSLSTKLVDIDAPWPPCEKITGFRGSVEAALFALRSGLQQRSESDAAAAAREVLELLIDTFHIVSKRLKSLLKFYQVLLLIGKRRMVFPWEGVLLMLRIPRSKMAQP